MKKSFVNLGKKKSSGGGSYGDYFVLNKKNKIGLKTLCSSWSSQRIFNCYSNFLKNVVGTYWYSCWHDVIMPMVGEYAVMAWLSKFNIPKAYELTWVKRGNKWTVGIVMSHIVGKTFCQSRISHRELRVLENSLTQRIRKSGIYISDWHNDNAMVEESTGKYYRIDLGLFEFKNMNKAQLKMFRMFVESLYIELMEKFPDKA